MRHKLTHFLRTRIERVFPEQRVFLRSDTDTRFIRLTPTTQAIAVGGSAMVLGWTILASAILLMSGLGAGNLRDQAQREQMLYEDRLNALSVERDARAADASAAHDRFTLALAEISEMQTRLLESEERRKELETGIATLRATLRTAMAERDVQAGEAERLAATLAETADTAAPDMRRMAELEETVDFLNTALSGTAETRDEIVASTAEARQMLDDMEFERELIEERNDRIFRQLEEAVSMSLAPLDEMFQSAGLPADQIIETVRRGYSGQGGPLTPLSVPEGDPAAPETLRANQILERLDELNLYRIAVQKAPFAEPVKGTFRFTSGFGPRRDPFNGSRRQHNGVDFAAAHGAPIYATADGVVTKAGWASGYGRIIKIRHDFGIETYYAHLARFRVEEGDRVSRGDRIGDMGNSGRSTGTHLHYEVRVGGKPINPMKYIKAARDVF